MITLVEFDQVGKGKIAVDAYDICRVVETPQGVEVSYQIDHMDVQVIESPMKYEDAMRAIRSASMDDLDDDGESWKYGKKPPWAE